MQRHDRVGEGAGDDRGGGLADALNDALAQVNPDELSPREALELLYRLKKL